MSILILVLTGLLCMYKNNGITYFDNFDVKHIPKEIIKFIKNKNIKTNIFRMQAYDPITCGCFCTGLLILCLTIRA